MILPSFHLCFRVQTFYRKQELEGLDDTCFPLIGPFQKYFR